MKENNKIKVDINKQSLTSSLMIKMEDISSVYPFKNKNNEAVSVICIRYGKDDYFELKRSNTEAKRVYFKIMKYIQEYNESKNSKDFLVILNDNPFLLSELEVV